MKSKCTPALTTIGWRELAFLPQCGIEVPIKAKVDTGAKTSALHAEWVEHFEENGLEMLRFGVYLPEKPKSRVRVKEVRDMALKGCCAEIHIGEAPLVDQRKVTNSGGRSEWRHVIKTQIQLGQECFETEITITNRKNMYYPMLIGRKTLKNKFVVNVAKSYCLELKTI